ncbi:MAG: hypothetical protein FWD13_06965 [Treponema sp.]|nr:hypothetical protein [Treponema sp.]
MFTIGNIITLGVVLGILALYRLADKNNRPLEKVKKYAEKCKEEIAAYAEEKSMSVKNFGIDLDVEKKSAAQLMKNIQKYTDDELAKKAESITRIEEHIKVFESSLEELFGMTSRVQENLSRIRDESAFVENTGRRVNEAKEKFEQVEKALAAATKNLEETEIRLEKKNTEAMNTAVKELIMSAKTSVSDFEATARTIERKIGEHREAVNKVEREREAVLNNDIEHVKKICREVLENAGKRADKMEDAAVLKLREQAQERVNSIKTFFDDKIKATQDALKNEQVLINEKLKSTHDKCNAEILDISTKQKTFHQDWVKKSTELESAAKKQKEEIITSLSRQHEDITGALIKERDTINASLLQQQNDWNQNFLEIKKTAEKQRKDLDISLIASRQELNQAITEIQSKSQAVFKQQHEELDVSIKRHEKEISSALSQLKEKSDAAVTSQHSDLNTALEKQMESWKSLCRDTEEKIITANEKQLNDYSKSHAEAVKQLNSLADDAGKLENELRLSMQNAVTRVNNDFAAYEKESNTSMENAASAFNTQALALRNELEEVDKELDKIRQQAYDNVSDKLTAFENDFTAELGKRASEAGRQIADWQAGLEERLVNSGDKISHEWHLAEDRYMANQKKDIAALGERITSDLEVLKREAAAFEEGIREEMSIVDKTRLSFAEQIKQDLAEMRISAENEVKVQIGQYQLSMQDTLRQKQRELENELEEISARSQQSITSLDNSIINSRQIFDEWQTQHNTRMRETDVSLEDLRRHSRENAAENDERISQFRQNLDDIRKELGVQKKIFDQTGDLKQELERRIEEINGDLDRLDQRKNEIVQLETQFTRIKRLEDEVNSKMTSFLSEKHRIELMENNFNSLIKTSQSVKDKLDQISSSNDILQTVQVQIRKLEDSLRDTDDKYMRIERKSAVLDETNEGIDRNFKSLQKTETSIKNAENIISTLCAQFDTLRLSIDTLASQNEKAAHAVEKVTALDETLAQIEKRISQMNVAREWVARIETDLKALDKDARAILKLTKSIIDRESNKTDATNNVAATPQDRDNILRLKRQGWSVEEIANAMGRARGEIELILEIASRG